MKMSVDVMLKKVGKKLFYTLAGAVLLLSMKMPIWAAETGSQNIMTLQQVTEDVELKAEPDTDAETLLNLPIGTGVIAHGEPQDSWTYVEYAGTEGYIESSLLVPYGTIGLGTDDNSGSLMQELQQEMETIEIDSFRTIEEYELERKAKRTSMIWGIIIVALVAGIFTVGVMSAISNNMEEKGKLKRKRKRADHDEKNYEDENYEEIENITDEESNYEETDGDYEEIDI